MPFLAGLDIVHYMRSERRLTKILIMIITAQENLKLMADSFSAGAKAFLPMPFYGRAVGKGDQDVVAQPEDEQKRWAVS